MNRAALAFVLGLGMWAHALDASALGFIKTDLRPGGTVMGLVQRDLNGDGKQDLAVYRYEDESGVKQRYVTIYDQAPGMKWTQVQEHRVPDDVIAFGLGDFLGEGRAQVIYLIRDAAFVVPAKGNPKPLISGVRFFFNAPRPDRLLFWDYVRDLNKDGLDDLIYADEKSYRVFVQSADHTLRESGRISPESYFERERSFAAELESGGDDFGYEEDLNNTPVGAPDGGPPPDVARGTGWAPPASPITTGRLLNRVAVVDANADGKLDLVGMRQDSLIAHFQTTDGQFGEEPAVKVPLGPQGLIYAWDDRRPEVSHGDINGDGRVDFVIAEIEPKELVTRLRVYYWKADGISEEPDQILKLSGLGDAPRLVDINGDGYLDVGYLVLRADEMMNLRQSSTESLVLAYYLHLFDPESGQLSPRTDLKHDFDIAIENDVGEDQAGVFTNFRGDFDGDGVNELMIFENRGKLLVYQTGRSFFKKELKLESKPVVEIPINLPEWIDIKDLDGDNKDEITLIFKNRIEFLKP